MMINKNLLIIYKNSRIPDLEKIRSLFEIIIISKIKKINFETYKKEGNILATKYNDIIFSTVAENIFFICTSELKKATEKLINFKLEQDFSYFTDKKTNNLLEFLSGFAVKREVLIRVGCLDKYVFNNIFLNFLINYSRFFSEKNFIFPNIRIDNTKNAKFLFWNYFERELYSRQPLQKNYYPILAEKFFQKKPISRIMNFSIPSIMNYFCSKINKFIDYNNYINYW